MVVNEDFKLGVSVELNQKSLADLTKQLQKEVARAISSGAAKASRKGTSGTTGTGKSVRDTASVSASDIKPLLAGLAETAKTNAALARVMDKVVQEMRRGSRPGAAPSQTSQMPARSAGPTNKELATDAQIRRQTGGRSRTTTGGARTEQAGSGRTGVAKVDHARSTQQKKIDKATTTRPTHKQELVAREAARGLQRSLDDLAKVLSKGALGKISNLAARANIPTAKDVRVGAGGTVEVKTAKGIARTIAKHVKLTLSETGVKSMESTDLLSKRLERLLADKGVQKKLAIAERTAARNPERAINDIRRIFKPLLDMAPASGGKKPYEKGGEAHLELNLGDNRVLKERLDALKDETTQIAVVNSHLWELNDVLQELGKRHGIETMGSVGLGDERAARTKVHGTREEGVFSVSMPIQTRDLAGMNLGGRGSMRTARSFQPQMAMPMTQGTLPEIMGRGEAAAHESGMFPSNMARNLRTQYLDPRQTPEVSEDMILISKAAAKTMTASVGQISKPMKMVAEDLSTGQKLIHGQVIGYDVEGQEVKFDLKGIEAEIESIENVVIDGINGVRIKYQEITELVTGSKIGTVGGVKGVVKVVDDLTKYGAAPGVDVATTGHGAAKRGVLVDAMKMQASEMAKVSGLDPQEIANHIEQAMMEGGQTLEEAIKGAAQAFGVEGFKGSMTGNLPWQRLEDPRHDQGPGKLGLKNYSISAMHALSQRAGEGAMAETMKDTMKEINESQEEYRATIRALAGDVDVAAEGLREMLPEDFRRLPETTGALEHFVGTLIDPAFKEALAIRMPTQGGEDRLLRLPSQGQKLGQRGSYSTALGGVQPTKLSRVFDRMVEQGQKIRMAEGTISPDVGAGGEMAKEMAFKTKSVVGAQVQALEKLRQADPAAFASAAKKFIDDMMPVLEGVNLTEGMKYSEKLKSGKWSADKSIRYGKKGMGAGGYVSSAQDQMGQVLRIQDVLSGRSGRENKAGTNKNIRTSGELFTNLELLEKAMKALNVVTTDTPENIQAMYQELEKLESKLVLELAQGQGLGSASTVGTKDPRRFPYAAQIGSGLATGHAELTAIQFRTDVDEELATVFDALDRISASGGNAAEALSALERLSTAQGQVAKIPRDAVFLNKTDYDNLVKKTMKEQGIGQTEAEKRVARPGLLQRYPVTGGGSFLAARAQRDPTGEVPEGAIGVAGPMAVSSLEDLAALRKPIEELQSELYETIAANQGQGDAADAARQQLTGLTPALQKLNQLFLATALNLDFDGDKISFLADIASDAGSGIETFTQKVEKGGVSFQQMMMEIIGGIGGGATGDVGEFSKMFGDIAKGRTGDLKRAVLMPQTGESAAFEATAHIAPKKSVGLLTDAYDKMLIAVTHGTKETGDAFATGLDYMMLNINESLAQKGGTGGTSGPMKLLEDLKSGNLGAIFKGMDAGGGGTYGKMGAYNKKMRESMKSRFTGAFLEKGGGALQDIGAAEGLDLPKDITYDNYKSVVDKMVDQLDLKAIITRMFDQMRANMVTALGNQGYMGQEAESMIQEMMGERGLDVDQLLRHRSPETAAFMKTRGAEVKGIGEGGGLKSAKAVMDMFGERAAEEFMTLYEEFDLKEQVDPHKQAGEIAAKLLAWYRSIEDTFVKVNLPEKVGGYFAPGKQKREGGKFAAGREPDEIGLSLEGRIKPFLQALAQLEEMSQGIEKTPEQIIQAAKAVKAFGATLAHENIHKASAEFPEAMKTIVRSLESGTTNLGQNARKIFAALGTGKSGAMAKDLKRVADLQKQARMTGEEPPELKGAWKKVHKRAGEELLAMGADPEKLAKFAEAAGIGAEGLLEISQALDELKKASPELIGQAMEITRQASLGMLEAQAAGMRQGLSGSDMGAAGFPGQQVYSTASDRLVAQEQAITEGQSRFGLSRVTRDDEGMLQYPDKMDQMPFAKEFPGLVERIKSVQEAAREGFPDSSITNTAEKEMRGMAIELQKAIQGMGGEDKGEGRRMYVKLMREFHLAVSKQFINKAKALQKQIAGIRSLPAGEQDLPKLNKLIGELGQTVLEHGESLGRSLSFGGRGRGASTSHIADEQGNLVPAAMAAGIRPSEDQFMAQIKSIGGQGKEGAAFFDQMGASIEYATDELTQGKDQSLAWRSILESLIESPDNMHANLVKVVDIMKKISKHLGYAEGQLSENSQGANNFAKEMNKVAAAIEGAPIRSEEDFHKTMADASKKQQAAAAVSPDEQYKKAQMSAESYRKELQRLIETEGYEEAGAPRTFESKQIDITGEGGAAIQKLSIDAKRKGKQIVVSLNQIGKAANETGKQMKNSLRRVVQWGFASGIVYGVVRAFRNMVSIITEVQTKMMSLQKVMDTSITDFGAMQDAAVGMAKNYGIAIGEVLDGMVVYGQQGLKMNEILERTRATMLAVNVTTLTAVDATEALTAAHKVFGSEVDQSASFVDAWAAVAAKHAITAKDLADAVKRSGAAAGVAGVDFQDFLGIVTAIGATTRQTGKEIATGTKFMFRAMRRPTAQKELGGLGISSIGDQGDLRPAMDVLGDVAKSWDNLSRSQKVNLAQAMAGIRHYNSFIVLMNNFDEALTSSVDAQNSQGFAAKKNALAMTTFNKQMEVMKQTLTDLALSLGKATLGPVTFILKGFRGVVDVLTELPTSLQVAGAAFTAMGLVGVKAADMLVDIWDLAGGSGIDQINKRDKPTMMARGLKMAKNAGQGLGIKTDTEDLSRLGAFTRKASVGVERLGMSFLNIIPMTDAFAVRLVKLGRASSLLAGAGAIGLMIAALIGLYKGYQYLTRSGADFEASMDEQIGKSKDLGVTLKSQLTQLDRVGVAYGKVASAMKGMSDPGDMKEALDSKSYKSAAVASHEFSKKISEIAKALADVGEEGKQGINITGMTDSGDYVVQLSEDFRELSMSAIDARNSITVAMQSKVIAEHAKDLTEVRTIWGYVKQGIGGATQLYLKLLGAGDLADAMMIDQSLEGRLDRANTRLNQAAQEREKMKVLGKDTADIDGRINDLYLERRDLQAEMMKQAEEIKKVMEDMPIFENIEHAAKAFSKIAPAVATAAKTGVFGRGATASSVGLKYLARTGGVGGVLDNDTAQSSGLLAGTLAQKGLRATSGVGAITPGQTGDILVLGKLMREELGKNLGIDANQITGMIANVNEKTGKAMYQFIDSEGGDRNIRPEYLKEVANTVEEKFGVAAKVVKFSAKESMGKLTEMTERVLNLSDTGAMAGVRTPKGGMPDIGVGRADQLTAEQRAMGAISTELERLANIQTQMGHITKEYSETVLSDVKGTYDTAEEGAAAFKALMGEQRDLVLQLQREAFDLSVLSHYQVAMEALSVTMDEAAAATRDANIEEQVRAKYLITTAGALSGMAEVPNIDFGKILQELTGAESLSRRDKGFGDYLRNVASTQGGRDRAVDKLTEIKKQKENFKKMVSDLEASGERLTKAQLDALKNSGEGTDAATVKIIKAFEEGNLETGAILGDQLSAAQEANVYLKNMEMSIAGGTAGREQAETARKKRVDDDAAARAASKRSPEQILADSEAAAGKELRAAKERKAVIAKKEIEGLQKFNQEQSRTESELNRANKALQGTMGPGGIAIAAEDFAQSLAGLVRDFKKEEALAYDKVKEDRFGQLTSTSDLEGPWARVGKAGFKTDFEKRQEDIDKMRGGKDKSKEQATLDFDEKEAKIKMQQDIETKALRRQQGQAEKLRESLYGASVDPALKGSGLQKQARAYMETLTSELQTSEQAEMRGGELQFKGVSSLGQAEQFMSKIRAAADEQAAEAKAQDSKQQADWTSAPIVMSINKQTEVMKQLFGVVGGDGSAFTNTPGLAMGIPAVGKTNKNAASNAKDRSNYGNATATGGNIVTTDQGTGSIAATGPTRMMNTNRADRRDGIMPGNELSEIVQTMNATMEGVAEAVRDLKDQENSEGVITAVEGLKDGIPVDVMGSVTIGNPDDIATPIQDAVGSIGSQVADQGLRLNAVEGVVDPDGLPIDERLEEMTAGSALKLEEAAVAAAAAEAMAAESALTLTRSQERLDSNLAAQDARNLDVDAEFDRQNTEVKQQGKDLKAARTKLETALNAVNTGAPAIRISAATR